MSGVSTARSPWSPVAAAASAAASRCGWPATARTSRSSTSTGRHLRGRRGDHRTWFEGNHFRRRCGDRDQVFAAVDHAAHPRRVRHHGEQRRHRAGRPLARHDARRRRQDLGGQRRRGAVGHPGRGDQVQGAGQRSEKDARSSTPRPSPVTTGSPCSASYSATKFAVRALTQAAAKEHAADGITVNADRPGVVGTDMWVEIDKRFAELTGAAEGETYDKFVGGICAGPRRDARRRGGRSCRYLAGPDCGLT